MGSKKETMGKSLYGFFIALACVFMVLTFPKNVLAADVPTQQQAYEAMISLKNEYYEGRPWTNDNFYAWNGGIFYGGYGCAGFAFRLSDEAFGTLQSRYFYDYTQVKVGDILRINGDNHSVIVLAVNDDSVTVAEGNYNSSIHWGRIITYSSLDSSFTYGMTRYPEGYTEDDNTPAIPDGMHKADDGQWYYYSNGQINHTYTGMAENSYGWWYFNNGELDWNYTGMAENSYGWWYYTGGRLDWNYTGMAENNYGWWYYTGGRLDWNYTGMAENNYGWWFYTGGRLDWNYNGVGTNQYGNWKYTNGRLDWNYNGKVTYNGAIYNVVNGHLE